jgi:hypothetical protein
MAKNKKRKKVQTYHQNEYASLKPSKTFLDACYATTRRIFRAMGEDESAFDVFTKRQKQELFRIRITSPRVQAMPGHRVPGRYLRYIQDELLAYLNYEYFDQETGLKWMDIVTIGQTLQMMFDTETFLCTLSEAQLEIVNRMNRRFDEKEFALKSFQTIVYYVRFTLMTLSQPNFRIYGQTLDDHQSLAHQPAMYPVVHVTAHECQSLRFKYHQRERTAFRVAMGQYMRVPYMGATIDIRRIFPNTTSRKELDIYIQSHAIHRFKERIDTFYPIFRNQFFILSLMRVQRVVYAPSGMQMIACVAPDNDDDRTIGYFAFTIEGKNLLVLTLLPLLSAGVPEGRVLYERLHLSADDLKYLGMDKLSFFYDVDIEQIPMLKKVLFDELQLGYIRNLYNSYRAKEDPFDEKKTLFVKNFFQKLEEQPVDPATVFDDLEEAGLL